VTKPSNRRRTASRGLALIAALAAGAALSTPALAGDGGVKIGTLSCHESSGWGFIFGSSHEVRCIYSGGSGHVEHYIGNISKFGVDIGYQKSGVLLWTVVAPGPEVGRGGLAGHYGGLTAGASAIVGASANALVGGSRKNIALQPLSIEGTTGLNVAAGIGDISLHYEPGA